MGLRTRRQGAARAASFMRRGIAFAMASGACYGLYTTFLTLAQTQGAWPQWLAGLPWDAAGVLPSGNAAAAMPPADGVHPGLSPITATFAMAALAAGLNDLLSGVWSLAVCAKNQQLGDLVRTVRSRPGVIMLLSAAIGGPFAATCYVVALNAATRAGNPGVIVPIAALNVTVGAILGRIMFGQRLNTKTAAGIAVCLGAGAVIGGASLSTMGAGAAMGCAFALLAAIGWGFEGCVAGFGTALIDYRIGIAIRQLTAGILEAAVLFPALAAIGGDAASLPALSAAALTSPAMPIFALSGLFAMPAYSFWYKGNSMCGAALGMACNGMYALWTPLFMWLLLGVAGIGGAPQNYPPLSAAQWAGAIIMVAGIFLIAMGQRSGQNAGSEADTDANAQDEREKNPEDARVSFADRGHMLRKALDHMDPPLSYVVILQLADGTPASARDVVRALEPSYGTRKMLNESAVCEMLATARENGLVEEFAQAPRPANAEGEDDRSGGYTGECDDNTSSGDCGETLYRITPFGLETLERMLGLNALRRPQR